MSGRIGYFSRKAYKKYWSLILILTSKIEAEIIFNNIVMILLMFDRWLNYRSFPQNNPVQISLSNFKESRKNLIINNVVNLKH